MQITRRLRWQFLAQSGVFVLLLALLVALLAYFAREYRVEHDLTRGARNTLSATTIGALKQLQGPVSIKAYAVRQDSSGSNVHKIIEERVRPYQRVKPDLQLQLIDPREQPKLAAEAGLRTPNALVIEYQRRIEQIPLAEFSEQSFANALLRLVRGANNLVLWIDGHGERKLDGLANHDLGAFGHRLREKGFSISSLNLAVAQEVPENAALLVLTQPQVELQAPEIDKLLRYIERGGNLLWLIDTEPLRGLQPLAEKLGLVLTPGTVVDPAMAPRSGPPVFAVATNYARHPVVGTLQYNTLFPHARQIGADDGAAGWKSASLTANRCSTKHATSQGRSMSPAPSSVRSETASSVSSLSAPDISCPTVFSATAAIWPWVWACSTGWPAKMPWSPSMPGRQQIPALKSTAPSSI